MKGQIDEKQSGKEKLVEKNVLNNQFDKPASVQFVDKRPAALAQRKLQENANNSPQALQLKRIQALANNSSVSQRMLQSQGNMDKHANAQLQKHSIVQKKTRENPIQQKENKTGLPDFLKSGIEQLSGLSMDDVKVHRNSDKPAQLQAHAYAQGTDIHLGVGQEKHLAHEAWHVVQQKQGRVKPTLQLKGKTNINDDQHLEREADIMGAKAASVTPIQRVPLAMDKPATIPMRGAGNSSSQGIYQLLRFEGWEEGRFSFISGWTKEALKKRESEIRQALTKVKNKVKGLISDKVYKNLHPAEITNTEKQEAFITLIEKIDLLQKEVNNANDRTITFGERNTAIPDFEKLNQKAIDLKANLMPYKAILQAIEEEQARVEEEEAAKVADAAAKQKQEAESQAKIEVVPQQQQQQQQQVAINPLTAWQTTYKKQGGNKDPRQIKYLQDQINKATTTFTAARNSLDQASDLPENAAFKAEMKQEVFELDDSWTFFTGDPNKVVAYIKKANALADEAVSLDARAKRGWNFFLKPLHSDIWWKKLPQATNPHIKSIAEHRGGSQHTSDHRSPTVNAFIAALTNSYFQITVDGELEIISNGHLYDSNLGDKLIVNSTPECLERIYQYVWDNGTVFTSGVNYPGSTKKRLKTFTAGGITITLARYFVVIVNTISNDLSKDPGTAFLS